MLPCDGADSAAASLLGHRGRGKRCRRRCTERSPRAATAGSPESTVSGRRYACPVANGTLSAWTRLQASAWLPTLAWLGWSDRAADARGLVAVGVGLSVVGLAAVLRAPRTLADVVTLARAGAVVTAVACPWWVGDRPWVAWTLLVAAAGCDLVDGAVARGRGATSHGAVLDMEADQLSVLAMATLVALGGGASWVLLLPAMRYAYVLAAWPAKLPSSDPKPRDGDNRRGKLVCAAVVVALLLALTPGVPARVGDGVTLVAVALLGWSFAADWAFLFGRRVPEARS